MAKNYQVYEHGDLRTWGEHFGGLSQESMAPGRFFLDKALPLEYFGVSLNSREPGEGADYWHAHSTLEELYLFLEGEGEMALDDDIIPVRAGTAVRVGQGVMRTWRASQDSPSPLRWLCIRAGGAKLKDIPKDAFPNRERPLPW
jgi:uncharacterized cupin superfamily protein